MYSVTWWIYEMLHSSSRTKNFDLPLCRRHWQAKSKFPKREPFWLCWSALPIFISCTDEITRDQHISVLMKTKDVWPSRFAMGKLPGRSRAMVWQPTAKDFRPYCPWSHYVAETRAFDAWTAERLDRVEWWIPGALLYSFFVIAFSLLSLPLFCILFSLSQNPSTSEEFSLDFSIFVALT